MVELFKDITTSDAHVETALGNEPGKKVKAKLFSAFTDLEDIHGHQPVYPNIEKNGRSLKPLDDDPTLAHTPFPHDPNALGSLRPDQTPRFFGALTDQHRLEDKDVPMDSLVAMQDRVDPKKVDAARSRTGDKPPVVVRLNGRHYIADGHHRLSAQFLNGENTAKVKFLDLEPKSNALKTWMLPYEIKKMNEDQMLIFGWASVVEKDGQIIIDKQGDVILADDLEKAAYDFNLYSRVQGDMHEQIGMGRLIESMMFTKEKQDLLGIKFPDDRVGWWTGFKVDSPDLWAAHKRGERPEFSIGGAGRRVEL